MINGKNTCYFTGHRPEKLHNSEEEIKEILSREIKKSIDEGYEVFISGMARGFDILATQTVIEIKKTYGNISLICAVPFRGINKSWSERWKIAFEEVLAAADETLYICLSFSKRCFSDRNKWMVDHSEKVIAFFSGERGGTYNTVRYAEKARLCVVNIFR